ncbi:hypothetical protein GBF35_26125 [Nonomuraea phyllanthi]|nr:hypothetical protein GBF35_26125 [Nonomuraea phyllanthi]
MACGLAVGGGADRRQRRRGDVKPCWHWIGAEMRRCGATPTRFYLQGWRCADHTPSALAGRPEPGGGYCAPARCYCGKCP